MFSPSLNLFSSTNSLILDYMINILFLIVENVLVHSRTQILAKIDFYFQCISRFGVTCENFYVVDIQHASSMS